MTLPSSPACDLLGSRVPIVLAGMGGVARSELVAAVTQAGGFGFLGMVREPPELIIREVERLRASGHHNFGVNIIPASTAPELLDRQVETLIDLAVPVVCTFWDFDARVVARLRAAGIRVVHQVGSVDEAIEAVRGGVEIIIAQGREAGGHVRGTRPLRDLLPEVVGAVDVPVLAAGGLATGSDLVTAMALGAAGIVLGTALMATEESFAHAYHKQRLLAAHDDDTVLTSSFHINWPPGAPVRVLKSAVTCGARGDPYGPERVVIGEEEGRPIYLFSTDSPLRSMTGDFESMALYAGTGVGRIADISSAGERMAAIMAEAEALLGSGLAVVEAVESSSPVCYAGEFSGAYMGLLDEEELAIDLWQLAGRMLATLRVALARGEDPDASSRPPFADHAAELAGWTLTMRQLATRAGKGSLHHAPPGAEISLLQAVGALVPKVAEADIKGRLVELREFLEGRLI